MRPLGEISFRGRIKYAFLFDRFAITVQDYMLRAPEGVERGARIEVQRLEEHLIGSEAAIIPTSLGDPIWRGDFFRLFPGAPDNWERAHYHPIFDGLEPCERAWLPELEEDPIAWVQSEFTDNLKSIFTIGNAADLLDEDSIADVRAVVPAMAEAMRRCAPAASAAQP
jgi:hypothetical protein